MLEAQEEARVEAGEGPVQTPATEGEPEIVFRYFGDACAAILPEKLAPSSDEDTLMLNTLLRRLDVDGSGGVSATDLRSALVDDAQSEWIKTLPEVMEKRRSSLSTMFSKNARATMTGVKLAGGAEASANRRTEVAAKAAPPSSKLKLKGKQVAATVKLARSASVVAVQPSRKHAELSRSNTSPAGKLNQVHPQP